MQAPNHLSQHPHIPLGQRRGKSDLAQFVLDLSWARADTESSARARAYPSPPMTGSPGLPPKPNEEAGSRGQGIPSSTSQDAYRLASTVQPGDFRPQPATTPTHTLPAPLAPSSHQPMQRETAERGAYSYQRPEAPMGRTLSYPAALAHPVPQPQFHLPPVARPVEAGPSYASSARPPAPENAPYTSPKSQRKTKGHVASACVPCKRAHLRCDAQRPCSRCLSNGKEDACVDVQHKKRGRPRLRDDREARFDVARFPHAAEPTMRRPVSLYSLGRAASAQFDDPLRRSQSFRVMKPQPNEPLAPRFLDRGSASDANLFPSPHVMPGRPPEPVAFLTLDLEIAKASPTFLEATGIASIGGRNLPDIVIPGEREKVITIQRALQDEQNRKEPNYLPPIFGKQETERVIQALPFNPETISRFQIDRQDVLGFLATDGQPRQLPIRVGLAKEDSIYFIVLVVNPMHRQLSHPSPISHPRDMSYSFQSPSGYSPAPPISGSFDAGRHRPADSREMRLAPRPSAAPSSLLSGSSMPAYTPSSSGRSDYAPVPPHYIPRSELPPAGSSQQTSYQLPPIRSHQQAMSVGEPLRSREDRGGKVDIGGLLEQPDPARR